MKYIGGKINFCCELHKTPLINATEREASCNFGIIYFYWWCNFGCKLCIWKACIYRLDPDLINLIDNNCNAAILYQEENYESDDNNALI